MFLRKGFLNPEANKGCMQGQTSLFHINNAISHFIFIFLSFFCLSKFIVEFLHHMATRARRTNRRTNRLTDPWINRHRLTNSQMDSRDKRSHILIISIRNHSYLILVVLNQGIKLVTR